MNLYQRDAPNAVARCAVWVLLPLISSGSALAEGGGEGPAAPAAPAAAPVGNAVFPAAVDPKYAQENSVRARFHTCIDQYNNNKSTNANGGLKWIQRGGGYYSECSKRLGGISSGPALALDAGEEPEPKTVGPTPGPTPILKKAIEEFAETREQFGTAGSRVLADECLGRFNENPDLDLAERCFSLDYFTSIPSLGGLDARSDLNRINYTLRKMGPGISKLGLTQEKQREIFIPWILAARTDYVAYLKRKAGR